MPQTIVSNTQKPVSVLTWGETLADAACDQCSANRSPECTSYDVQLPQSFYSDSVFSYTTTFSLNWKNIHAGFSLFLWSGCIISHNIAHNTIVLLTWIISLWELAVFVEAFLWTDIQQNCSVCARSVEVLRASRPSPPTQGVRALPTLHVNSTNYSWGRPGRKPTEHRRRDCRLHRTHGWGETRPR